MSKTALAEFYKRLVGPAGGFIPEGGTADALVCIVLHGNAYDTEIGISRKTALKQIGGGALIPEAVRKNYTDEDAWRRSLADMDHLVTIISAPSRVHYIHKHVHDWLPQSGLDPRSLAVLEHLYDPQSSIAQISEYLTLVRLFLLS